MYVYIYITCIMYAYIYVHIYIYIYWTMIFTYKSWKLQTYDQNMQYIYIYIYIKRHTYQFLNIVICHRFNYLSHLQLCQRDANKRETHTRETDILVTSSTMWERHTQERDTHLSNLRLRERDTHMRERHTHQPSMWKEIDIHITSVWQGQTYVHTNN